MSRLLVVLVLVMGSSVLTTSTHAQSSRFLEISFTPAERAQIAIWIEDAGGNFVDTVRLTEAVALRGVGNRPGATQMNSGFRWPYGRREGILPVWAHRRANAADAEQFKRVIFQDRTSEGHASRSSNDASRDDYFCLSFDGATTTREALDAVSCASVFNSDKGRFVTAEDVTNGYAEPFVTPAGNETDRPLDAVSLYPPRRDVIGGVADDHPDTLLFRDEGERVMPNIDAVTMATPGGNAAQTVLYSLDPDFAVGDYVAFIEVNVEGDYNSSYNDSVFPTPSSDQWDVWAQTFGYPYRGQPSVVYSLPFTVDGTGASFSTAEPAGFGTIHGETGAISAMDGSISDDPDDAPGSGADRLRKVGSAPRFSVRVVATGVCDQADPPPQCSIVCQDDAPCGPGFVCGPAGTCIGECDLGGPPSALDDLTLETHPDSKVSHRFAKMRFTVPLASRRLRLYEFVVDDGDFVRDLRAPAITENNQVVPGDALQIPVEADCEDMGDALCAPYAADAAGVCQNGSDVNRDGDCLDAGDIVELDVAFQAHQRTYEVTAQVVDVCQERSDEAMQTITTTAIDFTTVDPCFVATAAYGSPLASEISALREFRDNHLLTNAPGQAFVAAYYMVGPWAADIIRHRPWLRAATRTALTPLVELAKMLTRTDAPASPRK